jgi:PIN domain nuclease of toxin-antitoxin system
VILLDTHVLVWLVEGHARLGEKAISMIDDAASKSTILVSAISIWEIAMLVEKGRLALSQDIDQWVNRVLALPGIRLASLTPDISIESARLPGNFHADPADRIIVATARHRGAIVLTVDRAMLAYASGGHLKTLDASV